MDWTAIFKLVGCVTELLSNPQLQDCLGQLNADTKRLLAETEAASAANTEG